MNVERRQLHHPRTRLNLGVARARVGDMPDWPVETYLFVLGGGVIGYFVAGPIGILVGAALGFAADLALAIFMWGPQ